MNMNKTGKVFTIFLIIIAVLLITMTGISIFYHQVEAEKRMTVESQLQEGKQQLAKLESAIKDAKKSNFLLQEKNKEADDRINSLLDDLDLEEALREEMKVEINELKAQLDEVTQERDTLSSQVTSDQSGSQDRVVDLEEQLNNLLIKNKALEEQLSTFKNLESKAQDVNEIKSQFESEIDSVKVPRADINQDIIDVIVENDQIEKLLAVPENQLNDGRILSVDTSTDFVIINLGDKDEIEIGNILEVYRGKDYLGDIKVTRVQPEMAAADLVPPFSSRKVRKNDQVVIK